MERPSGVSCGTGHRCRVAEARGHHGGTSVEPRLHQLERRGGCGACRRRMGKTQFGTQRCQGLCNPVGIGPRSRHRGGDEHVHANWGAAGDRARPGDGVMHGFGTHAGNAEHAQTTGC